LHSKLVEVGVQKGEYPLQKRVFFIVKHVEIVFVVKKRLNRRKVKVHVAVL
jgi:hypothetical protein